MIKTPLISIVAPVYNVEKYLDRCVQSVLNQSFTDFELILVDDGSPDNCPVLCDEWGKKDNRIRVIHKENGGLADARNYGIRLAQGIYLTFIDSDDWIEPEFLNILYQGITENDADVAQCNYVQVYTDRKVNYIFKPGIYDKKYINEELIHTMSEGKMDIMSFSRWNKIYKTDIVKSVIDLCDISISMGEDFLMNFAVFGSCSKIAVLDTVPLYNYVFNIESMSSVYQPKIKYGVEKFHNNLKAIAQHYKCYKGNIEETKQKKYLKYLFMCMSSGMTIAEKREEISEYMTFINKETMLKYAKDYRSVIMYITFILVYFRLELIADIFLMALKRIKFLK